MLHLLRIALFTLLSLSHVLHASSREPTLHYFLDTHGHLTIEDLVSNSGDVKFAAATDLQLVVGFSRYPVWLKLQLPADNEHNTLKIDGFLLQQIDWYQQIDHPSAPTPPLHQSIQHPHLHTNTLAITPGVNSTVWIRLTADSAIQVAVALTTASPPHAPVINNLSLLVFAFTLSLGFVGVILHTQSQYQRLSLLSLQSLLLVCSGLNLPSISTLGYTDNALTGGLLLTFFMHLHHSAREQTWWSVRQLRIVRFLLTALLIANLWPSAPLTSTLLLLLGVLSYALWAPFAHMQRTSSALKIRLRMIMPDLFFWFICVGLLGLHLGLSPHPQQSAMVWSLAIFIFSLCLALMQIRTFIDEHRLPTNMSHAHLTDREAFKTEVFKNFAPQPILANSALLPQVKSGMRQVDSKERLHDHLSVIQQESRLQPTPEPTEAMFADT